MIATLTDESSDNNDGSAQYKKVLELGQLALKVVILINGVAAVSLLTFTGSILSSSNELNSVPSLLAYAIGSFGFGVLSGAIAVPMGYLSENNYYHSKLKDSESKKPNISNDSRVNYLLERDSLRESTSKFLNAALWLVTGSLTLFGGGVALCMGAFLCNLS